MNSKKVISVIICVACFISVISAIPFSVNAQQTNLYFTPSEVTLEQVSDKFDVKLEIENVEDLWFWKVQVLLDSQVLRLVEITEGDFLKTAGSTLFIGEFTDEVSCTVLGVNGATGSGTLAVFSFEVVADVVETDLILNATELMAPGNPHPLIDHSVTQNTKVMLSSSTAISRPIAHAGDNKKVNEDTEVTFDGSKSKPENETLDYTWNLFDGELKTLTGKIVTYVFEIPGTYSVDLTITNDENISHMDSISVEVIDVTSPVANLESDSVSGQIPLGAKIIFNAWQSEDPEGGELVSYLWNFGDGTTRSTDEPQIPYTYQTAGTYTVELTVEDVNHNTDSDTLTIVVGSSQGGQQYSQSSLSLPPVAVGVLFSITVLALGGSAFWLRKTVR